MFNKWSSTYILRNFLIHCFEMEILIDSQKPVFYSTKEKSPSNGKPKPYRHRTYNQITKIITGNPYVHYGGNIYKKTSIFPRQPFWSFTSI